MDDSLIEGQPPPPPIADIIYRRSFVRNGGNFDIFLRYLCYVGSRCSIEKWMADVQDFCGWPMLGRCRRLSCQKRNWSRKNVGNRNFTSLLTKTAKRNAHFQARLQHLTIGNAEKCFEDIFILQMVVIQSLRIHRKNPHARSYYFVDSDRRRLCWVHCGWKDLHLMSGISPVTSERTKYCRIAWSRAARICYAFFMLSLGLATEWPKTLVSPFFGWASATLSQQVTSDYGLPDYLPNEIKEIGLFPDPMYRWFRVI